jgi:flagellar hook-basal body complex protein FliE
MSTNSLESLSSQMKVMADMAAGQLNASAALPAAGEPDFQDVLKKAVLSVSEAQNSAQAKVQSFSTGESNMTLEEVMVSMQKANLSFQTMIAVRNRLVDAYKEVTNLQV